MRYLYAVVLLSTIINERATIINRALFSLLCVIPNRGGRVVRRGQKEERGESNKLRNEFGRESVVLLSLTSGEWVGWGGGVGFGFGWRVGLGLGLGLSRTRWRKSEANRLDF